MSVRQLLVAAAATGFVGLLIIGEELRVILLRNDCDGCTHAVVAATAQLGAVDPILAYFRRLECSVPE
jgi:hypothetical protein